MTAGTAAFPRQENGYSPQHVDEFVARLAQRARGQIAGLEKRVTELEDQLAASTPDAEAEAQLAEFDAERQAFESRTAELARELEEERHRVEDLERRLAEHEAQLAEERTRSGALERRLADIDTTRVELGAQSEEVTESHELEVAPIAFEPGQIDDSVEFEPEEIDDSVAFEPEVIEDEPAAVEFEGFSMDDGDPVEFEALVVDEPGADRVEFDSAELVPAEATVLTEHPASLQPVDWAQLVIERRSYTDWTVEQRERAALALWKKRLSATTPAQ